MTRFISLFGVLGLIIGIVAFISGLSGGSVAFVALSMFCLLPFSLLALGIAIGRATFEFKIERRAVVKMPAQRGVGLS